MSAMKPRGQKLAAAAYACIQKRQNFPKAKEYGALAHKLPAMILQNGLAQATGFLLAKGGQEHSAALDDLAAVISAAEGCRAENGLALHSEIIDADTPATMRLTRCALEASGWLKRYVQGVLRVDATGEKEWQ